MTYAVTEYQQPDITKQYGKGWVRISGLSVVFGEGTAQTVALTPTDLELESGTFTALIGPSGCGKSTLLNAVAGFTAATEGAVQVDGRKVSGPHPSVGVIFQNFALFPWFTARGNVEFALKRLGLSKTARRERACLLYTSPSPRDVEESRMPSSA